MWKEGDVYDFMRFYHSFLSEKLGRKGVFIGEEGTLVKYWHLNNLAKRRKAHGRWRTAHEKATLPTHGGKHLFMVPGGQLMD